MDLIEQDLDAVFSISKYLTIWREGIHTLLRTYIWRNISVANKSMFLLALLLESRFQYIEHLPPDFSWRKAFTTWGRFRKGSVQRYFFIILVPKISCSFKVFITLRVLISLTFFALFDSTTRVATLALTSSPVRGDTFPSLFIHSFIHRILFPIRIIYFSNLGKQI